MGVGELGDKGRGLGATSNALGMHIDDPRMDLILDKCAELHMPINIHVGEDKWMYEPMDHTNDGLMNAWKWRVTNAPGILQHDEVVDTLERAVKKHPHTIFIACHLANCCSDLNRLGEEVTAIVASNRRRVRLRAVVIVGFQILIQLVLTTRP